MIYQYGGQTHNISLERLAEGSFRATIDGRALIVAAVALDGGWLLTIDGQQVRVYSAARGDERYLSSNGDSFTLRLPEIRRRAASAGSGDLSAQMPGQVREVLVAAGDTVTRGQALLLLEAMKMEIRVSAPSDGRVKRLLVAAGDVVDRGQRLVEME